MRNNTTPNILNNDTGQKHSRRLLEAIRSNSYIQHDDTADGDEDNEEEDEEIEDIADAGQWKKKYNSFRHEIFVRNQDLIVDKLLSLNRTTKLKHRIVKMSEEQEECEFDRQHEREEIFKKIKQLRVETKALGNVKKIISYEQLESKFAAMKEEQMKVFTIIDNEKCELERQIGTVEKKIVDGEFENRNEQGNEDEQEDKDSQQGDVEGEGQDEEDEYDIEAEEEGQDLNGKSRQIKKQKKNQEIDPEEDEVQEILRAAGVEPIEDSHVDDDGEEGQEEGELNNDSQRNQKNIQKISDDGCNTDEADSDNDNDDDQVKTTKQQSKNQEEDQVNKYESELENLKKKAAEISEKMKSLGDKNLGWLQEDHAEFLRIRCRLGLQQTDKPNSSIQSKLIEECVNVIGVHSSEEVEEHAQLFQEFTSLGEERKELLSEYKEKKSQLTKLLDGRAKLKMNEDQEKREKVRQRRIDELAKKKIQVANWRQSEEGRKREIIQSELEKQKILTAEAAAQRIHSEQSNRQQTKELIKQYKLKKQEETEKMQQLKAQQELLQQKKMRRASLGEANRIKEKEEIMVKRKIILIQNLKEKQQSLVEETDNIERFKQLNKIKFPHIETRLSEPTKAAERRAIQKYEAPSKPDRFAGKADSFGGKVLAVGGRLRLPTWRTPQQ